MFESINFHEIFLLIIPILLALTVHEYAHGLAAWKLGDDTAKSQGRLTLNPLSHLDPIGTLMLFLFKFGWAKPVPFDPRNFKNPVRDTTLVALAGPVSNFITALVLALVFKLLIVSSLLAPALDRGSSLAANITEIFYLGIVINVSLGLFNLIPIPPLDGFKVLAYFLPARWVYEIQRNSLFIMLAFVVLLSTGLLGKILWPALNFCLGLIFALLGT